MEFILNIKTSVIILLFSCAFIFYSCSNENQKPEINSSNMIYEMLFDGSIRKGVKDLDFVGSDLVLSFNCDGNMNQMAFPNDNIIYNYQYDGDTIINQLSKDQRTLYLLNTEQKVKESQSQIKRENEWKINYTEYWTYDEKGRPLEKQINSPAAAKEQYFISREFYEYPRERKVVIHKYGKDAGSGKKNGLLRTETRFANTVGDWTSIEELDEDGIPFRNSSFHYTYDNNGNWTEVILHEKNNYINKNTIDTIQRKITYYKKSDCNLN